MTTPRVPQLTKIVTGQAFLDRVQDAFLGVLNPVLRVGATMIQGKPVPAPAAANDGQFIYYDSASNSFGYGGGIDIVPPHHTTHELGGSDEVTLAQSQVTGLTGALTTLTSDVADLDSAVSTIDTILPLKEDKANKGAANGYAPLDSSSKVPLANLPTLNQGTQFELGLGQTTDPIAPDAWRSVGSVSFNPGSYSGLSVYWQGIGSVSSTAATLSLKLRNVTDASDVDTRTFTALAPATSTSAALSLPGSTKIYEAWIRLTGGNSYDVGTLSSARLVVQ